MTDENEAKEPYVGVMALTRELAKQIEEETIEFAHYYDTRAASNDEGQSIEEQGLKLCQEHAIEIVTPGHLLECLERRHAIPN